MAFTIISEVALIRGVVEGVGSGNRYLISNGYTESWPHSN